MPNWCHSNVSIEAPKEEMDVLFHALYQARVNARIETDFGDEWLGHLLDFIGEYDENTGEASCKCRGWISNVDKQSDTILDLEIESAWAPHLGPIKRFCDLFAPNSEILYFAEEPGNGLYWTNDVSPTSDRYVVESYTNDYDTFPGNCPHYLTEAQMEDILREELHIDDESISVDELVKMAKTKWDNAEIIKFETISLEEVCDA